MDKHEYINFTFTDKTSFDLAKNVYDFLKTSRESDIVNIYDSYITIFPKISIEYFENNKEKKGWKFKNLLEFLQNDLDVTYIEIVEIEDGKGTLLFESNGYPYGGPGSLISLLKSMNLKPTKVFEGAFTYSINWLNEYEFSLTEIKEEIKLETKLPEKENFTVEKENLNVENENVLNIIFLNVKKYLGF